MDLGATVCRPKSPACLICPLTDDCAAVATGDPQGFPRRTAKAARPHRLGGVFVMASGGEIALVRRPDKGLLGGMLGLPTTPWRAQAWRPAEALAHAPYPAAWREIGTINHVFTHFSLDLTVFAGRTAERTNAFFWLPLARAAAETPSVFRKALDLAGNGDG